MTELSVQTRSLWAKTSMRNDEQRGCWSPLYVHMADSANVARYLWRDWLPLAERRLIVDAVGGHEAAAESLVTWLSGVHDIGKATPNFQCKVPERAETVRETGLNVPQAYMMRGSSCPHAFMGEAILDDWLCQHEWDYPSTYSCIIGGHHGAPPQSERQLEGIADNPIPEEVLGGAEWRAVQWELLDWMLVQSGMDGHELSMRPVGLFQPVEVLLTGLVIMSDWIASNVDLFPLTDECLSSDELNARVSYAWRRLDLPSSWHASEMGLEQGDDAELLFHERFAGLPDDARLRPAQKAAVDVALQMDEPGLIIIEAPMGNGKTEASLLCAEILARRFCDGGIAYLLPTMATSNAMFARVEGWLVRLAQSCGAPTQSMQLLHSKAVLNPDYARLKQWRSSWMGDGKEENDGDEPIVAHQWFGGTKRGLLASFVVGTVDQLLMAALKTRHVQLRHLGLAGKAVVVDEVHAYDAYMSTYLRRVLTWLGAYGVPTILLSATLPPARRKELMHAYRGHDRSMGGRRSRRRDILDAPQLSDGTPAYPLVTSLVRDKDRLPAYGLCALDGAGTDVSIEQLADDGEALLHVLVDALSEGGCACVLRDTVRRAQETYLLLRERLGGEGARIKLVHSRFIGADRLKNDAELLELLGPHSPSRPEKLIVVGTQVMEQSLDIDFDIMVTDIAPIDLLLQRMGRLHRHERGESQCERPPRLRRARCYITGVKDWNAMPPAFSSGIDKVYPKALLLRTILALHGLDNGCGGRFVNLPHDIARLVEAVYQEEAERSGEVVSGSLVAPDEWQPEFDDAQRALRKKQDDQEAAAVTWLLGKPEIRRSKDLIGWLRESLSIGDERVARATVRDSQESVEVIAVQEVDGSLHVFPWVKNADGSEPTSRLLGNGDDVPDDDVARLAATCAVNLPPKLSAPWNIAGVVRALEMSFRVPGWQESPWLKGQLVLAFDVAGEATIDTEINVLHLKYSQDTGLELVEEQEEG